MAANPFKKGAAVKFTRRNGEKVKGTIAEPEWTTPKGSWITVSIPAPKGSSARPKMVKVRPSVLTAI